jgi:DNA-binding beta-propeller fold protein YncE
MAFGREGQGPGEFWLPGGLAVDSRNRIYVADSFNKRIQVFESLEDTGQ